MVFSHDECLSLQKPEKFMYTLQTGGTETEWVKLVANYSLHNESWLFEQGFVCASTIELPSPSPSSAELGPCGESKSWKGIILLSVFANKELKFVFNIPRRESLFLRLLYVFDIFKSVTSKRESTNKLKHKFWSGVTRSQ